jgi:hypothetical protein
MSELGLGMKLCCARRALRNPDSLFRNPFCMSYDKAAVKTATDLMGLAPRGQLFVEQWLESWNGNQLPEPGDFPGPSLESLKPLIMITLLEPGQSATVSFMGAGLVRATGLDLSGMDWIAMVAPDQRAERLRRADAIGAGAILRTTREVTLDSQTPYFFETISVPLSPNIAGRVPLVHFADWAPPDEKATILHRGRSGVPEAAEIIALATVTGAAAPLDSSRQQEERVKIISRAAIRFLLNLLGDAAHVPAELKLDPIDYIIAIAVGAANVSHIDNDPALSRQYAGAIEPDSMRRGISRAAVSRATNLPLETVRRRINHLIEIGVLMEREDGIILSSTNSHRVGVRRDLMHRHAQLVDRMVRDIRARGVNLG